MKKQRTRHTAYQINYHFVWCPKFRRPVLAGDVGQRLEELLSELVQNLDGRIVAVEVQPDYVHLFAEFPPTLAPRQIMHRIKGASSRILRREFPWLNSRLPSLWTRSYYVGTAGNVSTATITRYIEEQKGK